MALQPLQLTGMSYFTMRVRQAFVESFLQVEQDRKPLGWYQSEVMQGLRLGDTRLGVVGGPNQNWIAAPPIFLRGGGLFNILQFAPAAAPRRPPAEAGLDELPTLARGCAEPGC
jgi:hypothetical protein